jgi:hypothetical protein
VVRWRGREEDVGGILRMAEVEMGDGREKAERGSKVSAVSTVREERKRRTFAAVLDLEKGKGTG